MRRRELPSREVLWELLHYDAKTGKFIWKERPAKYFKSGYRTPEGYAANWNAAFAGKEAFTANHKNGAKQAVLLGQHALAHQVAWKMYYGEEPDHVVHFDGDKTNNRIDNLRSVTASRTRQNDVMLKNNTSGIKGVSWDAARNLWKADIRINGRAKFIGRFKKIKDAEKARKLVEDRLAWGIKA